MKKKFCGTIFVCDYTITLYIILHVIEYSSGLRRFLGAKFYKHVSLIFYYCLHTKNNSELLCSVIKFKFLDVKRSMNKFNILVIILNMLVFENYITACE